MAKQLGAIVFTYKGEDIVSTILQFAQEYRVGHIVIGTPSRIPLWKRLLGKCSVADRLIREARGITVVVLDTRSAEVPLIEPVEPAEKKAVVESIIPPTPTPQVPGEQLSLTQLLTKNRIIIWKESVKKDDALRTLIERASTEARIEQPETVLDAVLKREEQGSTFFNEGVAFPHVRLEGLSASHVILGITQAGVPDVATEKPIQCIFLILSPANDPNAQLQILSLTSKISQDRHLMQTFKSSTTPDEILAAVRNWELSQKI